MCTHATTLFDKSPESVVREFFLHYSAVDLPASVGLFGQDCVFAMYVPEHVLPFGGETRGRAAVSDRLAMINQQFKLLKFDCQVIRVAGDTVH